MQAVYHTTVEELDITFIENIKKQFANAKVDIFVREMDETDYLNSSEKNKKRLQSAIKKVEEKKFIEKDLDEILL